MRDIFMLDGEYCVCVAHDVAEDDVKKRLAELQKTICAKYGVDSVKLIVGNIFEASKDVCKNIKLDITD